MVDHLKVVRATVKCSMTCSFSERFGEHVANGGYVLMVVAKVGVLWCVLAVEVLKYAFTVYADGESFAPGLVFGHNAFFVRVVEES